MNNSNLPQIELAVKAIERLTKTLEANNQEASPWLNKKQAYEYVGMTYTTFQKLINERHIKSHSLYELGIAIERFNRHELDEFLESL